MEAEQWLDRAKSSAVWNIGQLDAATIRLLNRAFKRGEICKSTGSFCGISPRKTIWHAPDAQFALMEGVTRVQPS